MRDQLMVLGVLAALSAASAGAQPARAEGLVVRLDPGYTDWRLDGPRIQRQSGLPEGSVQSLFVDQTPNGIAGTLELGYNILGHASIVAALSGTGWEVGTKDRGGAGFAALLLGWHPAELVPALRSRSWDAQLFGGAGYGIIGELNASDGLHLQFGARAEYFVTDWFSIGAGVRYLPLMFSRYVLDWNGEVEVPLPDRSGGALLLPSLSLAVHAPLGR